MKVRFAVPALALLLSGAAPACFAGEEAGRYTLAPAGNDFLRLDSATGSLAICRQELGGWSCEAIADDVLALTKEIDRLTKETEELRQRLAQAEARLEAKGPEQEQVPADPSFQLPRWVFDEMTGFIHAMIRHLQGMVRELKQQGAGQAL